jgi:hypothetical protein
VYNSKLEGWWWSERAVALGLTTMVMPKKAKSFVEAISTVEPTPLEVKQNKELEQVWAQPEVWF